MHVDEMAKIPFLINHYKEHKADQPDYTLSSFLYSHFIATHQPDSQAHNKSHSKLPFKSSQSLQAHYSAFTVESKTGCKVPSEYIVYSFSYREARLSVGFFDIWQPPKIG